MSRGCELRQISQEDAQLFVRLPEKLLALEQARYEARKHTGYAEEIADPARQFYDLHILMGWFLVVLLGRYWPRAGNK